MNGVVTFCFLLSAYLFSFNIQAQNGDTGIENEITAPVYRLFEGMETNDSTLAKSAFTDNATLFTLKTYPEGNPALIAGSVQDLLKTIAAPKTAVYKETLSNMKISYEGSLASVWCDYFFYLGEKFHHCGIDHFLLLKTSTGWKIRQITDTRKTKGCQENR
ncbi:MAG: nuclear transport factor 2 family protein [Cyclobacteriaceae bacterium]